MHSLWRKVAWTFACLLPVCTESRDWQSHARARPVYLSALDARVARACMHVALGSLDVHHVDVALLQTQNDERDDDERDEPDEREEVPDERVRVRFKNCETKRPRLGARTLKSPKS